MDDTLESINLPNSINKIRVRSFSGCINLKSVIIPNSVKEILDEAFEGCSGLKTIIISNSVKYIGENAFRGCNGLVEIKMLNPNPHKVECLGFTFNCSNCVLKVPAESVEKYKSAKGWKFFKDIVALSEEDLARYSSN